MITVVIKMKISNFDIFIEELVEFGNCDIELIRKMKNI